MEERAQWEAPSAEAETPAESPAAPTPEEEVEESSDDDNPYRPMRIRFTSARYLAQEARATREAWEPEPIPRSVEGREESPSASSAR